MWDEELKWPISGRWKSETKRGRRSCLLIRPPLFPFLLPFGGESPFPLSILSRGRTINAFTWASHLISRNGKESLFRVRLKVARFLGFPKDAIPLDPDYAWIFSSMYLRRSKRKGSDPVSANDTARRWPLSSRLRASLPLTAQPWIKFSTVRSAFLSFRPTRVREIY